MSSPVQDQLKAAHTNDIVWSVAGGASSPISGKDRTRVSPLIEPKRSAVSPEKEIEAVCGEPIQVVEDVFVDPQAVTIGIMKSAPRVLSFDIADMKAAFKRHAHRAITVLVTRREWLRIENIDDYYFVNIHVAYVCTEGDKGEPAVTLAHFRTPLVLHYVKIHSEGVLSSGECERYRIPMAMSQDLRNVCNKIEASRVLQGVVPLPREIDFEAVSARAPFQQLFIAITRQLREFAQGLKRIIVKPSDAGASLGVEPFKSTEPARAADYLIRHLQAGNRMVVQEFINSITVMVNFNGRHQTCKISIRVFMSRDEHGNVSVAGIGVRYSPKDVVSISHGAKMMSLEKFFDAVNMTSVERKDY